MRLPAAIAPLRHGLFRMLWSANVVVSLGVWMQNTGAGWLMTSLSPNPFTVSMVQAATIMPVFLLALPAGALADIIDKRRLILGTQTWMLAAAALLAILTYFHATGALGLLALTFAIGVGSAMNSPAWGSVMAEVVPRQRPRAGDRAERRRLQPGARGRPGDRRRARGGRRPGAGVRAERRLLHRGDRRAAHLAPAHPAQRRCRASTSSAPCAWACGSCATPR